MKFCYDPAGAVCPVVSITSGIITYQMSDRGAPTRVCVSSAVMQKRIEKWGRDKLRAAEVSYSEPPSCSWTAPPNPLSDVVRKPSHYQIFDGTEAIEVIASSMSEEAFHGYCLGNFLKYRLRAGNKDKLQQDIDKSNFYKELFDKHKHNCRS